MDDKIFRAALIALAALLLIFAALKIYKNFSDEKLAEEIVTEVTLYTRDACRFCDMAKNLLDRVGIDYQEIEISTNVDLQQKLLNQTGQNTVPYIFIREQFIGGYSNLVELSNNGKLLEIAIKSNKEKHK